MTWWKKKKFGHPKSCFLQSPETLKKRILQRKFCNQILKLKYSTIYQYFWVILVHFWLNFGRDHHHWYIFTILKTYFENIYFLIFKKSNVAIAGAFTPREKIFFQVSFQLKKNQIFSIFSNCSGACIYGIFGRKKKNNIWETCPKECKTIFNIISISLVFSTDNVSKFGMSKRT